MREPRPAPEGSEGAGQAHPALLALGSGVHLPESHHRPRLWRLGLLRPINLGMTEIAGARPPRARGLTRGRGVAARGSWSSAQGSVVGMSRTCLLCRGTLVASSFNYCDNVARNVSRVCVSAGGRPRAGRGMARRRVTVAQRERGSRGVLSVPNVRRVRPRRGPLIMVSFERP